jgi:hypothetical protein
MAWTDNHLYWNKYERATLELKAAVGKTTLASQAGERATLESQAGERAMEKCCNCTELFAPAVDGQQFCSKECYIPPCSVCHDELAFLNGDQPRTIGMPLCGGCYWEAEEELRKERVLASKNAAAAGKYTDEEIARMEDEALEKMYAEEYAFQELKAEVENALDEARHCNNRS